LDWQGSGNRQFASPSRSPSKGPFARRHRVAIDALVVKHGGRIVKTTGDGVLIEFPSVVDALECAVASNR
jgi:hypothetical protein